ncbi:hypothetical protein HZB94_00630 [Candidatus Falkowbacteria bacterium]|nr:hypothetical protein [Candidatus Falkowbacteria bacterium]
MGKPLSPPGKVAGMTSGQIEKMVDLFRAQLRKHGHELPSEYVQQVLGWHELGKELLAVIRKRVEVVGGIIVRHVKVDRTLGGQALLCSLTGWEKYIDRDVANSMPQGKGKEKDVYFFQCDYDINDDVLEKEYEARGLVPDIYAQIKVNIDNPSFVV